MRNFSVSISKSVLAFCSQVVIPMGFQVPGRTNVLMAWTLFYHSTGSSGPALLFVGTVLLTMLHSLHSCHFTVGTQYICSCYQHMLCCHLIVHPVQLSTLRFSWIPINHAYPVQMSFGCLLYIPVRWNSVLASRSFLTYRLMSST